MNNQISYYDKNYTIKTFSAAIVLDNLNDPRNVGVNLRLADAFGIRTVYAIGNTPTPPNVIIRRTARAAEKHLNIIKIKNASEALQKLKAEGYTLIALEYTTKSTNIRNFDFSKYEKIAIIAGNEEVGVSSETLNLVDYTCHVTQFGHGLSMNVSSALAVALYEITSQLDKAN